MSTLARLLRPFGSWTAHSHPERDERDALPFHIPPDNAAVARWRQLTLEAIDREASPGRKTAATQAAAGAKGVGRAGQPQPTEGVLL